MLGMPMKLASTAVLLRRAALVKLLGFAKNEVVFFPLNIGSFGMVPKLKSRTISWLDFLVLEGSSPVNFFLKMF
jgi:hypothetical protein